MAQNAEPARGGQRVANRGGEMRQNRMAAVVVATTLFGAIVLMRAQAPPSSGGVQYLPAEKVNAVFAKGGTLVPADGKNFLVMAGHRDKAGEAELHRRDTDILYIVEGKATFVTGGTMMSPRDTSPDEQRAPSVEGGETRTLAKGDVMIIPPSVPHWFKQVDGRFNYFVVKVR
jgi:mannose-6-phosphate isomerase-like protein (cupin superfamily)